MYRQLLVTTTAILVAAGCASVKQGVVGSVRADVRPFASETINTLSVDRLQIRRNSFTRLREYYDEDTAEVAELLNLINRIEDFRRVIALYSLELVYITGLDVPDEQKSRLLAEYLRESVRPRLVENLNMPGDEFDTIVDAIEIQKKYLHAIKGVQPLILLAYGYHETLLQSISDDKLPRVINLLDVAIEEDYAILLQQDDELEARRDELLAAMQLLNEATRGDARAVLDLHEAPAFRLDSVRPPAEPTEQDMVDAENHLINQLERNEAIRQLIRPSLDSYREARSELDSLNGLVSSGVKLARLQLAAWRRAHEDLGNGVRDPARWLATASGAAVRII